MDYNSIYTIRYVSQRTGLSSHVIRAWEKRYKAVVPHRSPKNRRLYSEEDVQRLELLKSATDAGHSISQVAQLDSKELLNLTQRGTNLASRKSKDNTPSLQSSAKNAQSIQQSVKNDHCKKCLAAVLNLDPEGLERSYDQAAIDLTRPALLREIIVPLFREIGELWQKGSLKIVNEHMATSVTRTFLLNMLRATETTDPAPAIVVATTVGQYHDVGALTVALTAAENGWHPVYYGPNLPAEEIATCVKQSGARAVAVSVTHLLNQHPLVEELRKLRRYLDRDVALFVGGRAVANCTQIIEEINAKYISDIDHFCEELYLLSTAHGE